MEQAHLWDNVLSLTRKIESQAEPLKSTAGKIPQLDLDVLMRDTRRLYDLLLELSRANAGMTDDQEPVREQDGVQTPEAPAADPEETTSADQPVIPTRNAPGRKSAVAAATPSGGRPAGLFDEISEPVEAQSVYDRIARTQDRKSLADKLSAVPAGDLKKMIGINEKFKFVNELFDGNLQDYNACIHRLNNAGSRSEAESFVEEAVVRKYEADRDSETFQALVTLIDKKFNR